MCYSNNIVINAVIVQVTSTRALLHVLRPTEGTGFFAPCETCAKTTVAQLCKRRLKH